MKKEDGEDQATDFEFQGGHVADLDDGRDLKA